MEEKEGGKEGSEKKGERGGWLLIRVVGKRGW